jgi:serine/threonine protein kinase
MMLSPMTRIGGYEIVSRLGAGGMGEVYRAHDSKLARDVAFKVLPTELAEDPERRSRLLREARAAASLNHPNICTIHDVGEADGRTYIAMELVDGEPLSQRIAGRPLPIDDVVRYGTQLADALSHAHERGVVHRDLKSANVMVTPDGRIKVLDFGLAKLVGGDGQPDLTTRESLSGSGAMLGTLPYMAPEQLCGLPVDTRTDIWALGVVLRDGGRHAAVQGRHRLRGELGDSQRRAAAARGSRRARAVCHHQPLPRKRARATLSAGE